MCNVCGVCVVVCVCVCVCVLKTKILTTILELLDLPAAVAFVAEEARKRGAAFVDVTVTSGPMGALFRAQGWSSAIDDPLIELPSLFYPVEMRHPPTTSVALWSRDTRDLAFDFSRLHLTRGDLDLDRPTIAWYEKNAP